MTASSPKSGCLACDLASGELDLPGGRVHGARHWVVEHCVGPLPAGTLLVKPFRHCLHLGDLTPEEAAELGPLLAKASACVRELAGAEQVYVCLWSHADWRPGHVHFVVEPAWARQKERSGRPGPFLQAAQFEAAELPARPEVEAFCKRARRWPGWSEG